MFWIFKENSFNVQNEVSGSFLGSESTLSNFPQNSALGFFFKIMPYDKTGILLIVGCLVFPDSFNVQTRDPLLLYACL